MGGGFMARQGGPARRPSRRVSNTKQASQDERVARRLESFRRFFRPARCPFPDCDGIIILKKLLGTCPECKGHVEPCDLEEFVGGVDEVQAPIEVVQAYVERRRRVRGCCRRR